MPVRQARQDPLRLCRGLVLAYPAAGCPPGDSYSTTPREPGHTDATEHALIENLAYLFDQHVRGKRFLQKVEV